VTPQTGRRIHLAMLLLWLLVGVPVSYWLRSSVPWLVFISVYAVVVSHWAGWSAERPGEVYGSDSTEWEVSLDNTYV
jgi:predicted alpha/beta hydrolase